MEELRFLVDIQRVRNYLQVIAFYFYYRQLYFYYSQLYLTCQQKTDYIKYFSKALKYIIYNLVLIINVIQQWRI